MKSRKFYFIKIIQYLLFLGRTRFSLSYFVTKARDFKLSLVFACLCHSLLMLHRLEKPGSLSIKLSGHSISLYFLKAFFRSRSLRKTNIINYWCRHNFNIFIANLKTADNSVDSLVYECFLCFLAFVRGWDSAFLKIISNLNYLKQKKTG